MTVNKVLVRKVRPSENALRDALAVGLAAVQGADTDGDAADRLGWSIGTVRNVRNRTHTISAKLLSDAVFGAGGAFLQPFLTMHDLRAVPACMADQTCDAGKVPALADIVARLSRMVLPESEGGATVTDGELIALAAEIDDLACISRELSERLMAARKLKAVGAQ